MKELKALEASSSRAESRDMWNPVKELKAPQGLQLGLMLQDVLWNPVKELKVLCECWQRSRIFASKWNPVKELKVPTVWWVRPPDSDEVESVESGEGIESRIDAIINVDGVIACGIR